MAVCSVGRLVGLAVALFLVVSGPRRTVAGSNDSVSPVRVRNRWSLHGPTARRSLGLLMWHERHHFLFVLPHRSKLALAPQWKVTLMCSLHSLLLGSNPALNTDRLQAALAGSLRRCAAPAAGYLKRWATSTTS